jgi:phosphatidate phosphatase APP1
MDAMSSLKSWAIISDLDDTIKESHTDSIVGLVLNSFILQPVDVDGMLQLYQHLRIILHDAQYWYISASPYTVFPYLRHPPKIAPFLKGVLILLPWNIALSFLWTPELIYKYKLSQIETICNLSARRFLCLGDSLQRDPEIYGESFRRFPRAISGIYIRVVGDVHHSRNSLQRFSKAFQDVPNDIWRIFRDPRELDEIIHSVLH